MGSFSFWHILILAIIVLLLFGGNRFSAMMGDVAKGLKSFKQGMADDDDKPRQQDPRQLPPAQQYQQPPIDLQAQPRPSDPVGSAPPPPAPPPSDDSAR